jgi:hypothetical protein
MSKMKIPGHLSAYVEDICLFMSARLEPMGPAIQHKAIGSAFNFPNSLASKN